ncbi:regulator of G-protein signaling 8-like isoform X2 [Ornithodoros turicata]|uniref:regulator of G-protein signaling 8-like isoform X2 n=1 Tax=Ornithodoros turicata TaxID=34597 RepID=UPI0031391EF4
MLQFFIVPVTKTKSADGTPTCGREDAEDKIKRNKKTLAQDMKFRLSFLRRRHTETSIHPSVRPSPEEAQKWAHSFQELTNSKYGLALFRAFLSREFSEENIEFWLACEDFKKCRPNKLPTKARRIFSDFVAAQAPKEVNLDASMRSSIMNSLTNPDQHAFDQAQRRIQGLMEQDAYLRFLQCDLYLELCSENNPSQKQQARESP